MSFFFVFNENREENKLFVRDIERRRKDYKGLMLKLKIVLIF